MGKTAVAVALAELLRRRGEDSVAISADALQVYEGLGTLTGAPAAADLQRLEHRLIEFVPVTASYAVGEYMPRAHAEIDTALAAGRRPIVVGGTGLYLRAALCDLALRPPAPEALRAALEREAERAGVPALHDRLVRLAPEAARSVDPNDRARVLRRLELLEMGETPPGGGDDSQLWTDELRVPTLLVGLMMERERLYARIDARAEAMAAAGAREEVLRAEAAGASPTARKALGYEELLAGDLEAMKRRSRNYAKRQLTWMRKLAGAHVLDVTRSSSGEVASEIVEIVVAQASPIVPRP